MPTFIITGRYTAEGAKGLISRPVDRAKAVGKLLEAAGGKLLHLYFTTGANDFLVIGEADDGADAVAASFAAAASGAVSHTQTVRAWSSAEFMAVAQKSAEVAKSYTPPGQG